MRGYAPARGAPLRGERPYAGSAPTRGAPKGAALWTPAIFSRKNGVKALYPPAGGTGDFGALLVDCTAWNGPPKVGQAVRDSSLKPVGVWFL